MAWVEKYFKIGHQCDLTLQNKHRVKRFNLLSSRGGISIMLKLFAINEQPKEWPLLESVKANKRKMHVGGGRKPQKQNSAKTNKLCFEDMEQHFKKKQLSTGRNDHNHKERLLNATGQCTTVRKSCLT